MLEDEAEGGWGDVWDCGTEMIRWANGPLGLMTSQCVCVCVWEGVQYCSFVQAALFHTVKDVDGDFHYIILPSIPRRVVDFYVGNICLVVNTCTDGWAVVLTQETRVWVCAVGFAALQPCGAALICGGRPDSQPHTPSVLQQNSHTHSRWYHMWWGVTRTWSICYDA